MIQVTASFFASCVPLSLIPNCGIQLVGPLLVCQQCPHQGLHRPSPWAFCCLRYHSQCQTDHRQWGTWEGLATPEPSRLHHLLQIGLGIQTTFPGRRNFILVLCQFDWRGRLNEQTGVAAAAGDGIWNWTAPSTSGHWSEFCTIFQIWSSHQSDSVPIRLQLTGRFLMSGSSRLQSYRLGLMKRRGRCSFRWPRCPRATPAKSLDRLKRNQPP